MKNMPGWFAPMLGLIIGAVGGFFEGRAMNFNPPSILPIFIACTAGVGFVAGGIVWYLDRQKRKRNRGDGSSS